MKIQNKIIISIISIFVLILGAFYAFFIYGIPNIANSPETISTIENILSKKINNPVTISNFKLSTSPYLNVELKTDEISSVKNNQKIIEIKNIHYKTNIFNLRKAKFNADNIFISVKEIKNLPKTKHKNKKFKLNKNIIPEINIGKAYIKIDDKTYIDIKKIKSYINRKETIIEILGIIKTPLTQQDIIIGGDGHISIAKDININNFSIQLKNSKLFLNSDIKNNDLYITARDLPGDELTGAFLYSYKLRHPEKKNFLENFYNLNGKLDVDLKINKNGFFGTCTAKEMKALFWDLKIPVDLPYTTFYFDKRIVKAETQGFFGPEPTQTDFYLTGIATKDLDVYGNVYSKFTNALTSKYFPMVKINKFADATVKYHVKDSIVDIDYILSVSKGNNILSPYGNLDNIDTNREINAHTKKNGDDIYLTKSQYKIGDKIIFNTTGNFKKNNKGKYAPVLIHAKTNGKIPVAEIKSFFQDYVYKGFFEGDIKYFFNKQFARGKISFYDIPHSNFLFLKNLDIIFKDNDMTFKTNGSYYNSPISGYADIQNNFSNGLNIKNIDIHLNKYVVTKNTENTAKNNTTNTEEYEYKEPPKVTVEKGHLLVDNISHEDFDLYNVEIFGSLKNNIASFSIPKTEYAGGILNAHGQYNVYTHSSDIKFAAKNVNSNIVVTRLFNLPDQVEGSARATLHLITKNKLKKIYAKATFGIDNGYLPKIGSREFVINKQEKNGQLHKKVEEFKFTLSKITNIDFNKPQKHYSNLYGSFILDDNILKDIDIYTKNDFVSSYIEGNYNIDTGYADLTVWGRHNKTAIKNIKIFKIPVNWIYYMLFKQEKTANLYYDKIKKIPSVRSKYTDMISVFQISILGNINDKNKKPTIILKDLK